MKVLLSRVSVLGVTAAVAMMSISSAKAQRRRVERQRHQTSKPPTRVYSPRVQSDQVGISLNKYMYQSDRINVSRALAHKIGYNKKIVALTIFAQSSTYGSRMVLLSQGQRLGSVRLNHYGAGQTIYLPRYANLNNLKLVMKGSGYVKKILAQTKRLYTRPQEQSRILKAKVNIQTDRRGALLPVKKLVKQSTGENLKTKKIKALIIKAKSLRTRNGYSNAMAQVLVDGYPVGQPIYLSPEMKRSVISLKGLQTQGASIKLEITGKASIQMVGLKVVEKHNGNIYHSRNY